MSWILAQKAKSLELDKNQREITRAKARSAVDRAMRLLAIELRIEPDTIKHVVANSLAQRKAVYSIKADVEREELRAIRATVSIASLTPTSPDKRGETINKLIMQLPPHGRQGCITVEH